MTLGKVTKGIANIRPKNTLNFAFSLPTGSNRRILLRQGLNQVSKSETIKIFLSFSRYLPESLEKLCTQH